MDKNLEMPIYLFHQGTATRAYEFLGAHKARLNGQDGHIFRLWAPNAKAVFLTGSFNKWDKNSHPMRRINEQGLWELFIANTKEYDLYKYIIRTKAGQMISKTDPYAFHTETRPATASRIISLDNYQWNDQPWLESIKHKSPYDRPMNIYEVHLGSWKRFADGNCFSYRKLAEELIPYVKDMAFTHLELMPICEYPFDGSWGYQVLGYYAPTSRYGSPSDFMFFIDACHRVGLGVILDWVPGHFPKDSEGLVQFDGSPCYEYQDPHKMEHKEWGTLVFDWGRNEVRSFLISNALFWFDKYHIDGLRVDAVASMLYLDYGREIGQWSPNYKGGRENLEAVAFLKDLNTAVFREYPHALMIAEESTAWPLVTGPVDAGGLGFNFKWNMGWMNDSLDYMKTDPFFRKDKHRSLTFPLTYAFSENYILPLSHDEVVHGKGSLLNKMPGEYRDKFAGLRAYLAYMMAHPGKKLLFMGAELGQFAEWDYKKELDWGLLGYEMHQKIQDFVKHLNHLYADNPPLWEEDRDWKGFSWISSDNAEKNILAFTRIDKLGQKLVIICNFAPVHRKEMPFLMPEAGIYDMVLNTDDGTFGGSDILQCGIYIAGANTDNGEPARQAELLLDLPPLSVIYLKRR